MRLLVINLGWEQEPLLDLISEQDVELYGIHYDSNYYKAPRYRDILISDLRDLSRILRYAEKIKPDAVISDQCDYSQFIQALIAEKMGLPGPRLRDAQIANNKILQRELAAEHGIPSPEFYCCWGIDDAYAAAERIGYPVMVKPPDNRGSFGVNRVDTPEQLESCFYEALVQSHSRTVLVEDFIKGQHLTVDGYIFQGTGPKALAVATKDKLKVKNSIIDGEIIYPGDLDDKLYIKAQQTLETVSEKFGLSFGFLHGEFILTSEGEVYLTEIANRGGGVFTSEIIVPHVSGVDINAIYLNDCIGKPIIEINYNLDCIKKTPVILKFFAFNDYGDGVVKKVNGIDKLLSRDDVLKLKVFIHPGDVIQSISNGAERHGMIILAGESKDDVRSRLKEAIETIEVSIEGH